IHVAGTGWIKHQADGIGAGAGGLYRVFRTGNAADFNPGCAHRNPIRKRGPKDSATGGATCPAGTVHVSKAARVWHANMPFNTPRPRSRCRSWPAGEFRPSGVGAFACKQAPTVASAPFQPTPTRAAPTAPAAIQTDPGNRYPPDTVHRAAR